MSPSAILDCAHNRWSPGIGDPSLMGWATVLLYVISAILALRTVRHADFHVDGGRREHLFWVATAALLAFLAVNKQLDLQSFMTAIGRCISQAQGWYEQRRAFQRDVIIGLGIFTVSALLIISIMLRTTLNRTWLAVVGLAFVCGFVLMRAVGFHHMDAFLNKRMADLRLNWVLEMTGPILVAIGALRRTRYRSARFR